MTGTKAIAQESPEHWSQVIAQAKFEKGLRDVRGVRERFREVQERFGRGRERNGLVTREEKGQLGKRQEERKKKK